MARHDKKKIWEVRKCDYCGKEYQSSGKYRYCCSDECKKEKKKKQLRENKQYSVQWKKFCIICNREFIAQNRRILCCSKECSEVYKKTSKRAEYKKPEVIERNRAKSGNLTEVAVRARQMGMTYGQYVARYGG